MTQRPDPWTVVSRDEFVERQQRARQAATEAAVDGLIIYSRGGAFMDMSADVLYLANHYSQQPYVADHVGIGTARSHGVLILPVDGPSVLVVDVPWWRPDLVVADDVRASIEVTQRVLEALSDTGLAGKRVGIVGASYMSAAAYLGLQNGTHGTELVRCDDLIEVMRMRKSPAEISLIKQTVDIGNRSVEAMMDAAVEGATEADAAAAALAVLAPEGAVLYDAACASGPNSHTFTWARLPSRDAIRPLRAGDLFHVDCYGAFGGYYWDFGRTRAVGDNPTETQRSIMEAAIEGVEFTCSSIKAGVRACDVFTTADEWMQQNAVIQSLPAEEQETEGFPAVGHGIGMSWEPPWLAANDETVIEPDMYLAVEMLIGHPSVGGAFFEHNGVVTENGFDVLTTARTRWWS